MKILVVSTEPSLAAAIQRMRREDEVVGINSSEQEVGGVVAKDGPFDAVMICHSRWQNWFGVVIATHPRTGLVLYSSHNTVEQCPPGTVWLEKPWQGPEQLAAAIRQAIANRESC